MAIPSEVLTVLPESLRGTLVRSFQKIAANYIERRWEPSELNGGKFCEVVYTILDGAIRGTFAARASKPGNMVTACRELESAPANAKRIGDRSLRILIPRMLLPLYEIRNNRGVGHVGGDVDPNFMDATAAYGMASWILAELIRIFHDVSTSEAQQIVDALVERKHPLVWRLENVQRVLDPKMPKKDQTLLLLHSRLSWVSETDLMNWIEYSTNANFRNQILKPLHQERFIEYDALGRRAHISPNGVADVEERILKSRSVY